MNDKTKKVLFGIGLTLTFGIFWVGLRMLDAVGGSVIPDPSAGDQWIPTSGDNPVGASRRSSGGAGSLDRADPAPTETVVVVDEVVNVTAPEGSPAAPSPEAPPAFQPVNQLGGVISNPSPVQEIEQAFEIESPTGL